MRLLESAKDYCRDRLSGDAIAGMTVTAVAIPQAMAYAIIAGVPPAYGLYTGIVTSIVGSLCRSSSFTITGPTNASAMVVASALQPYMRHGNFLEIVLLLTFLVGAIQVVFGLLRVSGVVRYVSNSVVTGITSGAGVLIAGNQLRNLFGLRDVVPREAMEWFIGGVIETLRHVPSLDWLQTIIGVGTIVFILGAKRLWPRLPGPLLSIILAGAAVYLFGWRGHVLVVGDLEPVPGGLALFHYPRLLTLKHDSLEMAGQLFPGALAVAILGLVEAIAVARAGVARTGERVSFRREFVGHGVANVAGAFFQCFPSSASFMRSALNYESGARTRVAGVLSGLATALVVWLLAPWANWIPICCLAGMLLIMASRLIDWRYIRLAWYSGPMARMTILVTFTSTILFNLKYSIFIGVFVSIVFLLRATGEATIKRLILHDDGDVEELPPQARTIWTPVAMIDLTGDLYFAAVQDLDLKLQHAIPAETRVLILRLRDMRLIGGTSLDRLIDFCRKMRDHGVALILCGVNQELESVMRRSGLLDEVGEENVFFADAFIFRSVHLAFARARALVGPQGGRRPAIKDEEQQPVATGLIARDVMREDAIRFGVWHRLREAAWLLYEARKRRIQLRRLFLQGEDARLAGAVDIRIVLREFLHAQDRLPDEEKHDAPGLLRAIWRRIHRRRLRAIADVDHVSALPTTPLTEIAEMMIKRGIGVIPVTLEGRILGQVHVRDVLIALRPEEDGADREGGGREGDGSEGEDGKEADGR